jgi:hypothetical protein
MSFETDAVAFLSAIVTPPVRAFYQHLGTDPGAKFIWFRRNGDERLDTIDGDGAPDIIYLDVEVYASSIADHTALVQALRDQQDLRGAFGAGTVEDLQISDQQDDYEPQATGDTLPPFSAAFRVTVTLYEE